MKRTPCVPNDFWRHTSSNSQRPAGTRLASPYPSLPNAHLHLFPLCMQQVIAGNQQHRTLSTAAVAFHLLPPSRISSTPGMARTGSTHTNGRLSRSPQQSTVQRARTYSHSHRSSVYRTSFHGSATATSQLSWLFRSNIPPRRGMSLPNEVQKRHLFGLGEIIGVIANVRVTYFISPATLG